MPTYTINTVSTDQSTLIINNPHNLGFLLAGHLHNQAVPSTLLLHEADPEPPLQTPSTTPPTITRHLDLGSDLSFHYVFYLIDLTNFSPKHLKQSLHALKKTTKFCLLVQHPNPTPQNFSTTTHQLETLLKAHLNNHHSDLRLIYLHYLYGPNLNIDPQNILSRLFHSLSSTRQLAIPDTNSDHIYPLYVKDALSGITKATFSRTTIGNIYHLAGYPVSLLNFSYLIRKHADGSLSETFLTSSEYTPPNSDQVRQFSASREALNWHPTSSLELTIHDTTSWYINHPLPSQDLHPSSTLSPQATPNRSLVHNLQDTPPPTPFPPTPPPKSTSNPPTPSAKKFSINHPQTPPNPSIKPSTATFSKPSLPKIRTSLKPPQIKKPSITFPKLSKSFTLHFSTPKLSLKRGLVIVFIVLFLNPFLFIAFHSYLFYTHLSQSQTALILGDFETSNRSAKQASHNITQLENLFQPIQQPTILLIGQEGSDNFFNLLSTLRAASDTIDKASSTAISAATLSKLFLGQEQGDISATLSQTTTNLNSTYHQLNLLQSKLKSLNQHSRIFILDPENKLAQFQELLQTSKPLLFKANRILSHAQYLLGLDSKKTYLILLQNSAELRPTGGFIGSYALVTLDQGKLLDIHVEDVYTADGQLRGHVEPPNPIKQYLGEAGWFLRDSNWDPHFPNSAQSASWFLNKEMGLSVDGVIALNLHTIRSILQVTGPIYLSDYDETITPDNLFERAEYQIEIGQFPGSTQKKDFIGQLSRQLIDQLINSDQGIIFNIFRQLSSQANQNQISFYFSEPTAQQIFSEIGWAGELQAKDCHQYAISDSCSSDYLAVVEANVGVNKANYFVTRSIDHSIEIGTDNQISVTSQLTLHNDSPSEAWPAGTYRNYLRFYVPSNSTLLSVTTNDQSVPLQRVDITSEHQKSVFGYFLVVPPQTTVTTKIHYRLANSFPDQPPAALTTYLRKQPGTANDQFSLTINYPQDYHLITTTPPSSTTSSGSTFAGILESDQHLTVELTR